MAAVALKALLPARGSVGGESVTVLQGLSSQVESCAAIKVPVEKLL